MGGVRYRGNPDQAVLVLNSSPIIYLCKAGLAGRLKGLKLHFRLLTSKAVYEEVYLKGIERRVPESGALRELFDGGIIEVTSPERVQAIPRTSGVHSGETSVISLALELDATAIIDDRRARQVARTLRVRISGTPGIIIELVKQGSVSKEEAKSALEKMVGEGWYCSARLFSSILKTIDET